MNRRRLYLLLGVPLALVAVVSAGTFAYINFIKEDAPERLSLDNDPAPAAGSSSSGAPFSLDGTWSVASGSTAGYRAKEVLFGQNTEGAGRTDKVTGQFVIEASKVATGSFTVDMASITSGESRRDNQFRGRIMSTSQFPTSSFTLTQPIDLTGLPTDGRTANTSATGNMTIRGVTRPVTIKLEAKVAGGRIQVAGNQPMVWADWGIPDPSFGPATVEDRGELEFLLVFAKAGT